MSAYLVPLPLMTQPWETQTKSPTQKVARIRRKRYGVLAAGPLSPGRELAFTVSCKPLAQKILKDHLLFWFSRKWGSGHALSDGPGAPVPQAWGGPSPVVGASERGPEGEPLLTASTKSGFLHLIF